MGFLLLPRCLCLFVLLVACMSTLTRQTAAWSVDVNDLVHGPCEWQTHAPLCGIPSACKSYTEPTEQMSPVAFEQEDLQSAEEAPAFALRRVFPEIYTKPDGGKSTGRDTSHVSSSLLQVVMSPGGMAMAQCTSSNPLYFQMVEAAGSTGTSGQSESSVKGASARDLLNDLCKNKAILEVTAVYFHNGQLHTWATEGNRLDKIQVMEIEVYAHIVKPMANSGGALDKAAYQSICTEAVLKRLSPDLIVSIPLQPNPAISLINASMVSVVLNTLSHFKEAVMMGASFDVKLSDKLPILPSRASDKPIWGLPAYAYIGSVTQPPCTGNVLRIAVADPILVPEIVWNIIDGSSLVSTVRTWSYPKLSTTQVFSSVVQQLPTVMKLDEEDIPTPPPVTPSTFSVFSSNPIIPLIALNAVLVFYFLLLIMARKRYIWLPTCLGGLNHSVQFWDQSYYALEKLRAEGLVGNSDTETPEGGPSVPPLQKVEADVVDESTLRGN